MANPFALLMKNEKVTIGKTEDGKSFLELRIYQKIASPPLFPGSDYSRSFGLAGCRYDPPLEPSISDVRIKTFADNMPPFEETIELSRAVRRG
ncbi:MAG TPA: hypothetical protein VMQ39_01615 [Candidatus Dormibacteraeota bacterium]|nr:hypothetical protein [Candidatus Dormibacteraeota bacterium]